MSNCNQHKELSLSKSVRIKRNIAAWLLVLTNVYWLVTIITGNLFMEIIPYETMQSMLSGTDVYLGYYLLQSVIIGVICFIAWCFLINIASNKVTRIISIVAAFLITINVVQFAINYFSPDAFSNGISLGVSFGVPLLWIYCYATLIRSNNISNTDKNWIAFLIVLRIVNILLGVHRTYGIPYDYNFQCNNIALAAWDVCVRILILVAEYRLVKCAAFTGNYNPESVDIKIYSPLNKYFAATAITVVIIGGLWYILYRSEALIF